MVSSIVEAVAGYAQSQPEKLCLADARNEATYREYWEYIFGYAKKLRNLGIKKGDRVVVKNAQDMETAVCGLAIQLLGAVFVPTEKSAADARVAEIAETVKAECALLDRPLLLSCPVLPLSLVLKYRDPQADFETFPFPDKSQTAEILFTTGTTGKSKGIELTHESVVAVAENVIDGVEMKKDNVEVIPVPISHSHGLRRYYANMLNGSSVVLLEGVIFNKRLFEKMDTYHATALDLVPAALSALFQLSGDRLGEYNGQLDYVQLGSAPIPGADRERLCRLLPDVRLYNFYGTTESGCSCILDFNAEKDKRNCIGRPARHARFAFFDADRKEMKATKDNPGFLACAGEMNMKGYYHSPQLNAEAMEGDYILTRDYAYVGEDGLIYMIGRQDDVIITGGNKVAPDEIEEAAMQFPGIADCGCIPVDHPLLGKEPKLLVCMKQGASFDANAIYEFLKDRLEAYKVPKQIEQIEQIPRTFNGKLQRRTLMQMAANRAKAESEKLKGAKIRRQK